jgi:uncharacterized protein
MEWRILFLGPVGAGKTEAIKTISDIDLVSTEEQATDETALIKSNTTVAMDMGVMHLGANDKVVLYGAPGQDRFDFMWEILLDQTRGLIILIDHSHQDPLRCLDHYLNALRRLTNGAPPPLVIGVTHTEQAPADCLDAYRNFLLTHAADLGGAKLPVFRTDARNRRDVRNLLLALTAMLEFDGRLVSASGRA